MGKPLIIAVDGPAASGKGTLAKKLAAHFGLPHLDTGLLYRAVGKKLLATAESDPARQKEIAIAAALALTVADMEQPDLGSEAVGYVASVVSAIAEVRAALLHYQRQFATTPGGAVLDGRDIGTVICPEAAVKLFITASAEVRAERRHKQLLAAGTPSTFGAVLTAILERDARDSSRSIAPLQSAADAVTIDTSALSAEQAFESALQVVNRFGFAA